MSLVLDPNKPWTAEEKEWARSSGRGYLIETNERRFPGGKAKNAAPHEKAGEPPESAQFGQFGEMARQAAVYDVGGVALPGTTLDYDTGRALQFDAEGNGVTVEPNPVVNSPGAYASAAIVQESEGFGSYSDQGDDIDDDIIDTVLGYETKADVQTALNDANGAAPERFRQAWTKSDSREVLNDKLALVLQDTRHPDRADQARQLASRTQPPVIDDDQSMLEQNAGVELDDNGVVVQKTQTDQEVIETTDATPAFDPTADLSQPNPKQQPQTTPAEAAKGDAKSEAKDEKKSTKK